MAIRTSDIVDVVELTVIDLTEPVGKPTPAVKLVGNNIMIGKNPVFIDNIMAVRHNVKKFLDLIRGAL